MFIVCAVEPSEDGHPLRNWMEHIPNVASKTLHGFIGRAVDPGDDSINGCEVNSLSIGQLSQYASLYLSYI
jgi:hypothetical protein